MMHVFLVHLQELCSHNFLGDGPDYYCNRKKSSALFFKLVHVIFFKKNMHLTIICEINKKLNKLSTVCVIPHEMNKGILYKIFTVMH